MFAEDDDKGQAIEMDAGTVIDADAEGGTSLSPSHSSDSASVNTVSTGSGELVKWRWVRFKFKRRDQPREEKRLTRRRTQIFVGSLIARLGTLKGETGMTGTSESVAEGLFSY